MSGTARVYWQCYFLEEWVIFRDFENEVRTIHWQQGFKKSCYTILLFNNENMIPDYQAITVKYLIPKYIQENVPGHF